MFQSTPLQSVTFCLHVRVCQQTYLVAVGESKCHAVLGTLFHTVVKQMPEIRLCSQAAYVFSEF